MPISDYPYNSIISMNPDDSYVMNRKLNAYENEDFVNYRKRSIKQRDFYFNKQWDNEEITANANRGQYTITINRFRKALNSLAGMLTANMPEFNCVPVGREDSAMSELATKILKIVWHNTDGLNKWRRCVMQGLRDNIGWMHVYVDDRGDIAYKNIPMEHILPDPESTDPMFRDAEYIWYIKWISVDQAKKEYGIDKEMLQTSIPEQWSENRTAQGADFTMEPVVSQDKFYVKVHEGYHRVVEREFMDTSEGRQATGKTSVRIEKETIIGYNLLYKEQLPEGITEIPLIPVYSEDTEGPYKLGEANFLIEYQRLLNKCFGIMLLNAQLASNPKVFVWEDTIPDDNITAFEDNYAVPGSINRLSGDGSDAKAPIIVNGLPLNNAWYQMVFTLFKIFEHETIPDQILGFGDNSKNQSPSSLLEKREVIMDTYRLLIGHIDSALNLLGKVTLQYVRAYTPEDKIMRMVDGDKVIERLEVNRRVGLDPSSEQSINMYREAATNQGQEPIKINSDIAKAKQDLDYAKSLAILINDVSAIDVDVHVVNGSYAPSYQMAKFAIKKELRQMDAIDNESLLEDAPIDNKQEIINRMSETVRLNAALSQAMNQLEEQAGIIEQMRQALIDGTMKEQLISHQAKLDKDYTQKRATGSTNVKLARQQAVSQSKLAVADFKNELNKIIEAAKNNPDILRQLPGLDELIK